MDYNNMGIVRLPEELLLDLIGYEGGRILGASMDAVGEVSLKIEHPEMPEVKQGHTLLVVSPAYEWRRVYTRVKEAQIE